MSKGTNELELELYIIRHGQTFGNIGADMESFSHMDRHDVPLTPVGQHQAELLGERFSNYPFDAIYASGLRRAMNTASEIVKRQPENGFHNFILHPLLSENGGCEDEYAGLSFKEAKEMFPYAVLAEEFSENDRMISFTKDWSDAMQLERANKVLAHIRSRYKTVRRLLLLRTPHSTLSSFTPHSVLTLKRLRSILISLTRVLQKSFSSKKERESTALIFSWCVRMTCRIFIRNFPNIHSKPVFINNKKLFT